VKSNEYFIPILDKIDVAQEIEKLEKELSYAEGFLKSVRAKLSNEKFVNSAPAQVVENERKKEADALAKIETIQKSIENLR
jgi:valine--tRNA ligase